MVLVPYALWRDRCGVTAALYRFWPRGLIGGALQALSYGIVLWAMTRSAIAVIVLKEALRAVRVAAAILIVCGLILLRVQ